MAIISCSVRSKGTCVVEVSNTSSQVALSICATVIGAICRGLQGKIELFIMPFGTEI